MDHLSHQRTKHINQLAHPEMPNILDAIVSAKRRELTRRQAREPLAAIQQLAADQPVPLNFAAALRSSTSAADHRRNPVRLIAEVKKASPSRGTDPE